MDEATKACDALIAASPSHPQIKDVLLIRAQCYVKQSQADKAAQAYDELLQQHPKFATAYMGRGWIRFQAQRFDDALKDFESGLRLVNQDSQHNAPGRGLSLDLPNSQEMMKTLDKHLVRDSHSKVHLLARALAKLDQRDYQVALADLNTLIEAEPDYVFAYHARGYVQFALKNYREALADFEEAFSVTRATLGLLK